MLKDVAMRFTTTLIQLYLQQKMTLLDVQHPQKSDIISDSKKLLSPHVASSIYNNYYG